MHNVSVKQALALLEHSGLAPEINHTPFTGQSLLSLKTSTEKMPAGQKEKAGYFTITKTSDINSPALIQYLQSRKIDIAIAQTYLKEIHFKPRNLLQEFFALGFAS